MSKSNFIYYKSVVKVLEDNTFYGITAKRNKKTNRILYTYCSIKYPKVAISVLTMKLDPSNIQSDKIVLGIKFNDKEVEGWNDFINELKTITTYKKKNGNPKKN